LIIEELKEKYKLNNDTIKNIFNDILKKYKNKEITKKEFNFELSELTNLLLEHTYYSKLYSIFNIPLHKKLLLKW